MGGQVLSLRSGGLFFIALDSPNRKGWGATGSILRSPTSQGAHFLCGKPGPSVRSEYIPLISFGLWVLQRGCRFTAWAFGKILASRATASKNRRKGEKEHSTSTRCRWKSGFRGQLYGDKEVDPLSGFRKPGWFCCGFRKTGQVLRVAPRIIQIFHSQIRWGLKWQCELSGKCRQSM